MIKRLLPVFFFIALKSAFAQEDKLAITPIHAIRGYGTEPTRIGHKVAVNGIVTATFFNGLEGFFIQQQEEDGDDQTSEGIFVFDPDGIYRGKPGDVVQVIGDVAELRSNQSSLTEIKNLKTVLVLSENNKLPKPKDVYLPNDNWDRYEGMLVSVKADKGSLFVTEMYQLGRFGQLVLSSTGASNQPGTDGRIDQFTQFNNPNADLNRIYLEEIARRRIVIDDGSGVRNPTHIPFGREGRTFSMYNALRGGDHVKEVTGILDHRFDGYRVQVTEPVDFAPAAKRKDTPPKLPLATNLKVGAFNVLNYFNGDGQGGGFPTERGANSWEEFHRQHEKIVTAILRSGADVLSLMEIENDGFGEYSAIQTLVNALNGQNQRRKFAAVKVNGTVSTDVITSAIIYDAQKVSPVGDPVTIPDGYGKASFDSTRRKPVIQTFRHLKTGEEFTLLAIHLKSKGIQSAGEQNMDRGDGQGRNNQLRTWQAEDLINWLSTKPTGTDDPDYLLIGDFNSYAMEDPLVFFDAYGFKNLFPNTSYSYVYDGQWGSLDHALGTESLQKQVTKAYKWHVNSEEAPVLDYNLENKTPQQAASYYSPDMYRSSDHDPLIIGLRLKK